MKKLAYISGPYSSQLGSYFVDRNINAARDVAYKLWSLGIPNICPHSNTAHFHGMVVDYDTFLRGELLTLERCDLIVMLPAWANSGGAIIEMKHAMSCGKPVYDWPKDCCQLVKFCWPNGLPARYQQSCEFTLAAEDFYADLKQQCFAG